MSKILTRNAISPMGLSKFSADRYEVGDELADPDALLLRSFKLAESDLNPGLLAIGRAGAGVNNIPVPACTKMGIVVFNTPGANANAVKELVNVGMLLSARRIVEGIQYVNSLAEIKDHAELNQLVEGAKKNYKGSEIAGKTLGVVGLGAIGALVAQMGLRLGMDVVGYDPLLSVAGAWNLSRGITRVDTLSALLARSDYVSLHVPVADATRGMIDAEAFGQCKEGAVLLNFARAELVATDALVKALGSGRVRRYVSDFPVPELIGVEGALQIPHLGASTDEAEDNCAMMVADQVIDFLENGNITNSVNFPALRLDRATPHRVSVVGGGGTEFLEGVTSALAEQNAKVAGMASSSTDEIGYALVDLESAPDDALLHTLNAMEGVLRVRAPGPA